jgi:putative transferase (TIGR04331 family)
MSDSAFLGLTGLSEFWDKEQQILFLGRWCLRRDNKQEWEHLNYSVLPCPWDDRERFYRAADYLGIFYEQMLDELTQYLNTIQGTAFSKRYWRIIIGPWLLQYIHVVYDRYVLLTEAQKNIGTLHSLVLNVDSYVTPFDMGSFARLSYGDHYNVQLFSQLLGGFDVRTSEVDFRVGNEASIEGQTPRPSLLRRIVGKGPHSITEHALRPFRRQQQISLCDLGCSLAKVWALVWQSRFVAQPVVSQQQEWCFEPSLPVQSNLRKDLGQISGTSGFEKALVKTLKQNFPSLYLEDFHRARNEMLNHNAALPSVIVSSVGWYENEMLKFLAAESAEKQGRLIAVQHGGGYGMDRHMPTEKLERSLSDCFMAWGWAPDSDPQTQNLPSLKIPGASVSRKRPLPDSLLFVIAEHPRYLYRFQSTPVGSQWEGYWQWQHRFALALPPSLRKFVEIRCPQADFGTGLQQRMREILPEAKWDPGSESYAQRLQMSRMVIVDNRQTTFLEALAANVPTIMYYDRDRWEARTESEKYLRQLEAAGILWHCPEDAARKVSSIYADPDDWWFSETVQEARNVFVRQFAFADNDWVKHWVKALEQLPGPSEDSVGDTADLLH